MELLEGGDHGIGYAPLSQSQTVAISRHLQEQIKQLQAVIEDHQREHHDTHEAIVGLKEKLEGNIHAVHELSDGMGVNKATCESNRKWLSRVSTTMSKMQNGLDHADEGIGALKDAEQVNASCLKKLADDLNATTEMANRLQAGERRAEIALRTLQDELAKSNLQIAQLRTDGEALKTSMQEGWESIRENSAMSKLIQDNLDETNTLVRIIERRLGEAVQNARGMKQDLEETNGGLLKLHEDHENTKAHSAELQSGMRRVTGHLKTVQENVDKNSGKLELAVGKLGDGGRSHDHLNESVQELASSMQALQQGQNRSNQNVQHLQRELANVSNMAHAVKAGLKEQSSLLLPNIHMDSMDARTAVARHGSMLNPQR